MTQGERMRMLLAAQGIFLDETKKPSPPATSLTASLEEPDRDEIRAILVRFGAPPDDLDWLVASCPSVEDAYAYQAPAPMAWCPVCDGPRAIYAGGCVVCRAQTQETP